ncbi:MAG: histone deacetylase [Planctomycetes bacterium]|nr:histone deacetylase [Planctomycetota bacterium]
MTILFADPLFHRHDTGRHPEKADRLVAIQNRLENAGLVAACKKGTSMPLSPEAVCEIHTPEGVGNVKRLAEAGGGWLEADTLLCAESYQVALAASGACVAGVDQVLRGVDRTALCLVRPPGHHATARRSMGFCLFNNVALAAHHARKAFGLDRILVVDWDVHHGNGTQDIFWADPAVFFLSIHRFGHGFYPGSGDDDETGTGAGLGYTVNVPIAFGTSRSEYAGAFRNAVEKTADSIKPDLIILSAGFDAHTRDPIGSLGLESEDFSDMTKTLLTIADTHAQGRLVSCLEGGYNLEALAESVQAHLEELLHH